MTQRGIEPLPRQTSDNEIQTPRNSPYLITAQALPTPGLPAALSLLSQTQLFPSRDFQVSGPVLDRDRKMSALGSFLPAQGTSDSPFADANLERAAPRLAYTSTVQQ